MENDKDQFLFLIWKDPVSRRNYTIGKLTRNETGYTFQYDQEYMQAKKAGWNLLEAFPNETKVYQSDSLFSAFACRLPDPKRRDIEKILQKYGLDHFDGFELLKRTTGRLPIDTYEFIDSISPDETQILREFYIDDCSCEI